MATVRTTGPQQQQRSLRKNHRNTAAEFGGGGRIEFCSSSSRKGWKNFGAGGGRPGVWRELVERREVLRNPILPEW